MPAPNKVFAPLLVVVMAIVMATFGPRALFFPGDDASAPATSAIDGLPFPNNIKVAGSRQLLIGGGTRLKWGVRVYSVGIYGDHKLCKSLKQEQATASTLSREFLASRRMRTVLLRFRRAVASSAISDALGEALSNKVTKCIVHHFIQHL